MKHKVIYEDSGVTKAVSGVIVNEDDFLVTVQCDDGVKFRIGKRVIVSIKEVL